MIVIRQKSFFHFVKFPLRSLNGGEEFLSVSPSWETLQTSDTSRRLMTHDVTGTSRLRAYLRKRSKRVVRPVFGSGSL